MIDTLYQLREQANASIGRGDLEGAANLLVQAAGQTHVAERDYSGILRILADVLIRLRDYRSALTVLWYLAPTDGWEPSLAILPNVVPVDRARTLSQAGQIAAAASEMEAAGMIAQAAILREQTGDWQSARALWSRIAQISSSAGGAYNGALVAFNLARCAAQCGDKRQAREATVASVRLLEEAADYFESVGQRERAFDCFQVLIELGRVSEMFEDVLAGFVNCIRILREDHLKYFALQYFEEALGAAREKGEISAAATLAREASDYSRALGMSAAAVHYVLLQASLWREVAALHIGRGSPPEISENALLAAVLSYGELGQFGKVGEVYRELAVLPLDDARKAHYTRASKRYDNVRDEPLNAAPLPAHLRQDSQFPDVWHVDLIEWEQQGSAAEAAADILLDRKWPDLIRRRAMLTRLTSFAVEGRGDYAEPHVRAKLAVQLAELQLYGVLSPLEKLFEHGDAEVKIAVLGGMQTLFFKRTFVTMRAALREPNNDIVNRACMTIEALCFPHAFDPLVRILRETKHERAKSSAIAALARIDTQEAAEFMLSVLEHGSQSERAAALAALKRSRGMRFTDIARAMLPVSSAALQEPLRDILRSRGVAA